MVVCGEWTFMRCGMTTKRSLIGVTVLGILLAACGGSGGGGSNGEADKSPDQILSDAVAALKSAKSVHLVATENASSTPDASGATGGPINIAADVQTPGAVSGTFSQGGATGHFVLIGGKFYLQGKQLLNKLGGQATADVVGDNWVVVPASTGGSGVGDLADMNKLATCLQQQHGTLSKGGTATVNGQDVVIVVDKGDKPGGQPGKLYVATSGTAYLLKVEQSGPVTPGGDSNGPCGSSNSGGTATFSDYNKSVTVTPPPNPIDFSKLGG
jgi:hypothetical protein